MKIKKTKTQLKYELRHINYIFKEIENATGYVVADNERDRFLIDKESDKIQDLLIKTFVLPPLLIHLNQRKAEIEEEIEGNDSHVEELNQRKQEIEKEIEDCDG